LTKFIIASPKTAIVYAIILLYILSASSRKEDAAAPKMRAAGSAKDINLEK
jgi:hypothetical protein